MAGSRITVDESSTEVSSLDVDVHEGRQLVVLEQLAAERREAAHQVVEQLADGAAARLDLTRALGLAAQRRWDPHAAQCPTPEQNST